MTQFTLEEIRAAVTAAENWGTYVTVHGYTPRAVSIAIDAGVKVIEHGQLLDRETVERISEEGIWLSFQPFTPFSEPHFSPAQNAKQAVVCQGTANVYQWISEMPELKVTHGADTSLNSIDGLTGLTAQLERLEQWFEPYQILQMATGNGGELLKPSGPRSPYQGGDLGIVAVGAYADLLLVEGNPLDGVAVLGDPENLRIIMKDGEIHKNTLD